MGTQRSCVSGTAAQDVSEQPGRPRSPAALQHATLRPAALHPALQTQVLRSNVEDDVIAPLEQLKAWAKVHEATRVTLRACNVPTRGRAVAVAVRGACGMLWATRAAAEGAAVLPRAMPY